MSEIIEITFCPYVCVAPTIIIKGRELDATVFGCSDDIVLKVLLDVISDFLLTV